MQNMMQYMDDKLVNDYQAYIANKKNSQLKIKEKVLLIISGEQGLQCALNIMKLPIYHLTICPVLESDIERVKSLEGAERNVESFNLVTNIFDTYGGALHLSKHSLIVAASGRPFPNLYKKLNEVSLRLDIGWTKLAVFGHKIMLGPTVIPQLTACYQCYKDRLQANSNQSKMLTAIDSFLDMNTEFEYSGSLDSISAMAASYLSSEIRRILINYVTPISLSTEVIIDPLYSVDSREFVCAMEYCDCCQATGVVDSSEFSKFVDAYTK